MSSDILYNIYAKKTHLLTQTTVIYSDIIAKSINTLVEQLGYKVDVYNKKTWMYVMNLAGDYHPADKARISKLNKDGHPYMRIKVAGDNESKWVDFTKELMSGELGDYNLASEYVYGSDYYKELVRRYPGCEQLILGILNPISYSILESAKEGDILYMGGYYRIRLATMQEQYGFVRRRDVTIDAEFLIEEWEESIITSAQQYIQDYIKKWYIRDYQANHEDYISALMAGLYANLPNVILLERIKRCRTPDVHSYHLLEYIDKYGYLAKYALHLNREQQMYLYDNLDWLSTNKGKAKTLDSLVDNLLTPYNIPLIAYNLSHETKDLGVDDQLYPTPLFNRESLNDVVTLNRDIATIASVVNKSTHIAKENAKAVDQQITDISKSASLANSNTLKTKVLESVYTEIEDSSYYDLDSFQVNQWIYSIYKGTYRGSIHIDNPRGGRLQLTPYSAFNLYLYAFSKGYHDIELETGVPLRLFGIPKSRNIIEDGYLGYPDMDRLTRYVEEQHIKEEMIAEIAKHPSPSFNFSNVSDFHNKTKDMHRILTERITYALSTGSIHANSQLELILSEFYYLHLDIPPLLTTPYKEWLISIGIEVDKMTRDDYKKMADTIIYAGIGKSLKKSSSVGDMHDAVMKILDYFTSYTIQIISKFNSVKSSNLKLKLLRTDQAGIRKELSPWVDFIGLRCLESSRRRWFTDEIKLPPITILDSAIKRDISSDALIGFNALEENEYRKFTHSDSGFGGFSAEHFIEDKVVYESENVVPTLIPMNITIDDVIRIQGRDFELSVSKPTITLKETYGLRQVGPDSFNFTFRRR